ncbi:hypothetical protein ANN_23342 [Periplaneta americana]|uniref:Uncharacterized protein n=1 Tax=Periplaneta americana TaxID=6978 RepID=A0ABQ8SKV4_PERAM|nr:hypothetical protein ANN_23342 [Periplaneta americana]
MQSDIRVISDSDCLILKPITDTIVRVRDEDNLVLAAYVESEESNIYWFGSEIRRLEQWKVKLDCDRRSTSIITVIPEQHLWVKASTTCSIDEPDLNCQNSPHGHVTWEYSGCNVTISDVNHKIVCEFDKCESHTILNTQASQWQYYPVAKVINVRETNEWNGGRFELRDCVGVI